MYFADLCNNSSIWLFSYPFIPWLMLVPLTVLLLAVFAVVLLHGNGVFEGDAIAPEIQTILKSIE